MNKIVSTKKISATFLAIVLIVGTIAMISPSFIPNAQAAPYGMDNYKPSFGKDKFGKNIGVKYIKCNNINVNVNGLELDINDFPPGLLGADAAETQASGLGSGSGMGGSSNGPSKGFDNDGFVFVCINNNNNRGQGGGDDGNGEDTCAADIERCFRDTLGTQFAAFEIALGEGIELEVGTQTPETVTSYIELCNFLREQANLDRSTIDDIIGQFEQQVPLTLTTEQVRELTACIAVIFDIPVEME